MLNKHGAEREMGDDPDLIGALSLLRLLISFSLTVHQVTRIRFFYTHATRAGSFPLAHFCSQASSNCLVSIEYTHVTESKDKIFRNIAESDNLYEFSFSAVSLLPAVCPSNI